MTTALAAADRLRALDEPTRALVRLSAIITAGSEAEMRAAMADSLGIVDATWIEELILQSYLFAGFPRALNAAREWRRVSGRAAPADDEATHFELAEEWRRRGEITCEAVYGDMYRRLRVNIRKLHPALDAFMVVDGYGKVLSRRALDLKRRELCIIAACAAARQDRQLHSHLLGALNVGATHAEVDAALAVVEQMLDDMYTARIRQLWARVRRD
jgi:4-carboxymuconolactone decarboxylase